MACSHSLRIKAPILFKGNRSYQLIHTRYNPASAHGQPIDQTSNTLLAYADTLKAETTTNGGEMGSNNDGQAATTSSAIYRGFSRDHTLGGQILEVLEGTGCDRKVHPSFE